jgi:hypothetical protein
MVVLWSHIAASLLGGFEALTEVVIKMGYNAV